MTFELYDVVVSNKLYLNQGLNLINNMDLAFGDFLITQDFIPILFNNNSESNHAYIGIDPSIGSKFSDFLATCIDFQCSTITKLNYNSDWRFYVKIKLLSELNSFNIDLSTNCSQQINAIVVRIDNGISLNNLSYCLNTTCNMSKYNNIDDIIFSECSSNYIIVIII